MEMVTKEATVEVAYGKKQDTPIKYKYTYPKFKDNAEFEEKGERMSITAQRKFRDKEAALKARAAAQAEAFDAAGLVKPTIENDEQLRLREFVKVLLSGKKMTEEAARELASDTLGIEWDDEA